MREDDERPAGGRGETPEQHADRNFSELVQEVRVAQTGVQILFAFLLSLPFLQNFPETAAFKRVLTGALLCAAAATICFIAPVAFHRSLFRRGRKEETVRFAHHVSSIGLGLLAAAMGLATWLVLASLWSSTGATVTVVVMLVLTAVLWVVVPRWVDRRASE